jgi:hypothetical protein
MKRAYNEMKLRALTTFEAHGWLSPPAWAVLAGYYPVRAAYTYIKRLCDRTVPLMFPKF